MFCAWKAPATAKDEVSKHSKFDAKILIILAGFFLKTQHG
jgi:hypothetical protein